MITPSSWIRLSLDSKTNVSTLCTVPVKTLEFNPNQKKFILLFILVRFQMWKGFCPFTHFLTRNNCLILQLCIAATVAKIIKSYCIKTGRRWFWILVNKELKDISCIQNNTTVSLAFFELVLFLSLWLFLSVSKKPHTRPKLLTQKPFQLRQSSDYDVK